ncbi:MAG: hypothetical protein ABH851_03880 [Methanobacteriota archaeon]
MDRNRNEDRDKDADENGVEDKDVGRQPEDDKAAHKDECVDMDGDGDEDEDVGSRYEADKNQNSDKDMDEDEDNDVDNNVDNNVDGDENENGVEEKEKKAMILKSRYQQDEPEEESKFFIDQIIKIKGIRFRVRKITNKDLVLRPVDPQDKIHLAEQFEVEYGEED